MIYTLYTRGGCTACDAAKRYLNENDVEYKEVYLLTENDITHIKSFLPKEIRDGRIELPLVFRDDSYIGGKIELIRDHQHSLYNSFDKQSIFNLLRENVCSIIYEKTNGDTFQIRCTLLENKLPGEMNVTPAMYGDFITVYNLDEDVWCGFHIRSLKSITITG